MQLVSYRRGNTQLQKSVRSHGSWPERSCGGALLDDVGWARWRGLGVEEKGLVAMLTDRLSLPLC